MNIKNQPDTTDLSKTLFDSLKPCHCRILIKLFLLPDAAKQKIIDDVMTYLDTQLKNGSTKP